MGEMPQWAQMRTAKPEQTAPICKRFHKKWSSSSLALKMHSESLKSHINRA